MGLFDIFRETIFLKEDSNLEKQINELKEIRDKIKDKKQIDKDIKLLEFGLQGEKEIAFELKNANIGMYVLHDITISFEDLKAQIDYIIITKGSVYLVECKNLYGDITIDNQGQFTRSYVLNGNKIKEGIYSPYTQAVRHRDILKKRWLKHTNKFLALFREKSFENYWYKPLVVLSNSKSLLNTRFAPSEVKMDTIRVDQLVNYIKKDLENYDKYAYLTKKEMFEVAESFLKDNVIENYSLVEKYKKEIVENEMNSENNVCPECGGRLVVRNGKYSKFIGCSNFPKCRYTKKI